MANEIKYRIEYPAGFSVTVNSIKAYKKDIDSFLHQYPKECVRVYRGKKLYAKYGLIDGDLGFTRIGAQSK